MSEVSAPWLHATLADAAESLAADEETASELLRRDLVEVYAKLNYAVNTAYLGSEALNVLTEDELVAWPAEMPFATLEELDAAAEEEEQKALNADV